VTAVLVLIAAAVFLVVDLVFALALARALALADRAAEGEPPSKIGASQ
jgi:hypothetical protein